MDLADHLTLALKKQPCFDQLGPKSCWAMSHNTLLHTLTINDIKKTHDFHSFGTPTGKDGWFVGLGGGTNNFFLIKALVTSLISS